MPQKSKVEFTDPDVYIRYHQQPVRETLEALRNLIRSVVPEAEELISYQVVCFRYHYMLVGIGAAKDHCSLYVMSTGLVQRMRDDLQGIKVSGSTLHFKPGAFLPEDLIRKIVLARMMENQIRASRKK